MMGVGADFFRFVVQGVAVIVLVSGGTALAQPDWHLKKEEDGIRIYTKSTANSNFKTIRVDLNVNARLSQLVAFLLDVDHQKDWVYNSRGTRLLRRPAANETIFYSEIALAWPCANRDYISDVVFTQPKPQAVWIDAHAIADYIPEVDGKVRIHTSNAHWEVLATSPNQLSIIYIVQFDPGGSLPAWLVNMFITKAPIHTFKKLREQVNRPEYQNAHVDFIKE